MLGITYEAQQEFPFLSGKDSTLACLADWEAFYIGPDEDDVELLPSFSLFPIE